MAHGFATLLQRLPMKTAWLKSVFPLFIWAAVSVSPAPAGLSDPAWHYFGIFAAVIAAIILEPLPSAAAGFLGITVAAVAGHIDSDPAASLKWAISGFGNTTVWLIFGAFMLSMGYQKTGLGRRVALVMVRALGSRTLGLGYAIACADLLMAPGTPSNSARSGGTIYPVIANIPALYDSRPGPTARRIGAYLMWTAFAATAVTSALFLTAMAPNLLAITMVRQATGFEIDWSTWFFGILPVAAPLFLLVPLLVYVLYPPEIKRSPEVPRWAASELDALGPMSRREKLMAALVGVAVLLWIFGGAWVHATTVVLIAISLMVVLRVVSWDEILDNRTAWNVLIWFATLVALADGLARVGFIDWAAGAIAGQLTHLPPALILVALVAFNFLVHYLFASLTAHTMAVFPVVLAVGQSVPGLPIETFALLLCYSIGLMGILTPYATGPAPVYYASGYIAPPTFWKLGAVFGAIFLAALLLLAAL